MLIEFEFSNWKSFKNNTVFSMFANTRIGKNRNHICNVLYNQNMKSSEKVLPFTALYGANNSGKTGFIDAISFCQSLISGSSNSLKKLNTYRLSNTVNTESYFCFTISIRKNIYKYSFKVDSNIVIYEKLEKLKATSSEVLFERLLNKEKSKINNLEKENPDIGVLFRATPKDKLFISHLVTQDTKVSQHIYNIYNWFENKLTLLSPSSFHGLISIFSCSSFGQTALRRSQGRDR